MSTNLYALIEARPSHPNFGRPFYIGIGTAKRPYRHLAQSRATKGHRNLRLHEILVSHRLLGIVPGVQILAVYPDKATAGQAEKEAIKLHGRQGIEPTGILCNLASGGQGPDAELMRLPEVRKRNSDAQKRRHPDTFLASTEAARRNAIDPQINATRAAVSTAMNNRTWADPEIRARRTAAMLGKKKTLSPEAIQARRANGAKSNTPEANALKSKASLERWARPEFVAMRSRNQTAAWADPEKRANMLAGRSEGISKSWDNPEVRARRIVGIKAAAMKRGKGERGHDD